MPQDIPPNPRRRMLVPGVTPLRKVPAPLGPATIAVGHGYDIHRLEKSAGKKLVLAGVIVSEEIAPIAHSDGDVIYHALCDAILGALGQGDIGELFGDTDPRWKNADSGIFVQDIMQRVRSAGLRVGNADITLLLERPKIAPLKSRMIENLRGLLEGAAVNLKAGTNEGCDAIGRGEAVAAHAVVVLLPANA